MDAHGHVRPRDDPFLPAAGEPAADARRLRSGRPRARVAAAKTRKVLRDLLAAGAIDQATYDRAAHDYAHAVQLARKLKGTRRAELRGVVAALDGIAARGLLTAPRLPELLETLQRNVRWWAAGPLLADGRRVEFAGSELVWQEYAGQGIQIQWLGTFGKANGLWQGKVYDDRLQALLDEALALAVPRAGGIAWEYLFPFDGGQPPWVSGLAQGTALSALSRAAVRLAEPKYFVAARSALGIFETPPPQGVADRTARGTHYLQYSYAPKLHVLNGFVQSLNGLFDFALLANDDEGRALFSAGEAELLAELPRYDTGGWSRYSQYQDSDVHYHVLLRDFLRQLCARLDQHGQEGTPFCDAAQRFTEDLVKPPALTLLVPARAPRAKHAAQVRFGVDKPATVSLELRRAGFLLRRRVALSSGRHAFAWKPPKAGPYRLALVGVDLLGHTTTIVGTLHVRP
jgi:hypothetical protein